MNRFRPYRAELAAALFWLCAAVYLRAGLFERNGLDVFLAASATACLWLQLILIPVGWEKGGPRTGAALAVSLGAAALVGSMHIFGLRLIPSHYRYYDYTLVLLAFSYLALFMLAPRGGKPWPSLLGAVLLMLLQFALTVVASYAIMRYTPKFLVGIWLFSCAVLIYASVVRSGQSGRRTRILALWLTFALSYFAAFVFCRGIGESWPKALPERILDAIPVAFASLCVAVAAVVERRRIAGYCAVFCPTALVFSYFAVLAAVRDKDNNPGTVAACLVLAYVLTVLGRAFARRHTIQFDRLSFRRPRFRFPWPPRFPRTWLRVAPRRALVLSAMILAYALAANLAVGSDMFTLLEIAARLHLPPLNRYEYARALIRDRYVFSGEFDVTSVTEPAVLSKKALFDPKLDRHSFVKYVPEDISRAWSAPFKADRGEIGCQAVCAGPDRQALVVDVAPGSPADKAGIEPGDTLLQVNETDAAHQACENMFWKAYPLRKNEKAAVQWRKPDGRVETAELTTARPSEIRLAWHKIIEAGGAKIGYFKLREFSLSALDDMEEAFGRFRAERVGRLIVDVRFNPGGEYDLVKEMCDNLIDGHYDGHTLAVFRHNAKYRGDNHEYDLGQDRIVLHVPELVVLASALSCSASEIFVESLKPYLPVKIVGEPSCGKPYSVEAHAYDGLAVFLMVGKFENALGQTYGADGLAPDYRLPSAVTPAREPEQDATVAAALALGLGQCPALPQAGFIVDMEAGVTNF